MEVLQLWNDFKSYFSKELKSISAEELRRTCAEKPTRTSFYIDQVFPAIAALMKLKFQTEKPLRVDALFYEVGSQTTHVPIIALESENSILSSHEEIEKLCFLSAPLKILLVNDTWTEERKKQIRGEHWDYIIDDFVELNVLAGLIVMIVADIRAHSIDFHSYAIDSRGQVIEEELFLQHSRTEWDD